MIPIDRPIKAGVVGLHFGFQYLHEHIGEDGRYLDIEACCDLDQDLLDRASDAFECKAYASLDTMLDEADIEAVLLFTQPQGRIKLIRRCLEAGKHVMTTKPIELQPEGIEEVFELARARGLALHLNSPTPTLGDDIVQVNQWRRQYDLGQPVFTLTDCWYPMVQRADGSWYDDPKRCPVAPIFRLGIYGLNDTLAVVDDVPIELQVLGHRLHTDRAVPDVAQMSVRFERGTISTFRATWCCEPDRSVLESEYVFERGVVRRSLPLESNRPSVSVTLTLSRIDRDGVPHHEQVSVDAKRVNNMYRWDLFHQVIRGTPLHQPINPRRVADAIRIIRAMSGAETANGSACLINSPPKDRD